LIFYSVWNVYFLPLILGSVIFNFALGRRLTRQVESGHARAANLLLTAGLCFNLGLLAYFKYSHFLAANMNAALGTHVVLGQIILPLGISFFTFEQIGYLTDLRRGAAYRASFAHFMLFVVFFPRLVAGPILRYAELGPQFRLLTRRGHASRDLVIGLTIFFIGLCKKSLFADGIAVHAGPVFDAAAVGQNVDLFAAWGGVLCYTLQLYFDFSGYSDMAIGAARCFGIRFPLNFDSPYKSTSIILFWRRWHMTLSRFLRDYLYIGLGGNRRGPVRRYVNLLVTMVLGGFWHGANWTFLIWGLLHGIYLMLNHGFNALRGRWLPPPRVPGALARFAGWAVTFAAVVVGWVFFRAKDVPTALHLLAGMSGRHGAELPAPLAAMKPFAHLMGAIGVRFTDISGSHFVAMAAWVASLGAIALALPNTQQIMWRFAPALDAAVPDHPDQPAWRPSLLWSVAGGAAAFTGILAITRVSEFLYWQF